MRSEAFGQSSSPSIVDRFGVWLSSVAVRRHATFDGLRVGDFGCGYHASFARQILPRVQRMLLVDIQLAEDLKNHPKVQAIVGPIEGVLPALPPASLDVVLCLSVLEHLNEPQEALDAFHRVLVPGGLALINVPTWRGKWWLELSAFRLGFSPALEMDDHKRYYDPRNLWPMLVHAGFRPSEIYCRRHKFGLTTFAACRVSEPNGSSSH
ncbi:MAG TPA: methyltransferase domain-containing protein [Solirubrobacteraceae bacterium]|jgi:SAM-dependent methyltransferase|nr:methyltransferase domain-containing protein [Solirubrobacteraceae bacterium]